MTGNAKRFGVDKKQLVLAIDTATEYCSAALQVNDQIFVKQVLAPQKHAALILGMVEDVLEQAMIDREDLELIGFGRGPGSFTGVRIACSVAQGLALGLDKPVFGIDDLKLLAYGARKKYLAKGSKASDQQWVVGSIDARMGEVYFAMYKAEGSRLEQVISTQVCAPVKAMEQIKGVIESEHGDLSKILGAGSGIAILQEHGWQAMLPESEDVLYPHAEDILQVYAQEDCELLDAANAEPLYCRNEVTWKKIGEQ